MFFKNLNATVVSPQTLWLRPDAIRPEQVLRYHRS
jgi:hypothetical protein